MGEELRVALNGEAYKKMVAFLVASGINVSNFLTDRWSGSDLLGGSRSYYSEYIEKDPTCGSVSKDKIWTDTEGKPHRIFNIQELPFSAREILGRGEAPSSPHERAILIAAVGMYNCFNSSDCDPKKQEITLSNEIFNYAQRMESKALYLMKVAEREDLVPYVGYESSGLKILYNMYGYEVGQAHKKALASETIVSSLHYLNASTDLLSKMLISESGFSLLENKGYELGCEVDSFANLIGDSFFYKRVTCRELGLDIRYSSR